ncbi:MAG: nickel/cobalt transporter [Rhodospirillaceae bacterium]
MTPGLRRAVLALAGLAIVAAALWLAAGGFADVATSIQLVQRDLHRRLAAAMRAMDAQGAAAGWTLIGLSLLYGVFHAAGPGHGKAVIATYLATQESRLKRGLALSLLAALAQGVTAVAMVESAVGLLGLTMREAQGLEGGLEAVSFGLIAVLGIVLAAVNGRRLLGLHAGDGHRHDHSHHQGHGHDHHAGHACGHAHGPSARDLDAAAGWRGMAAVALSIGIRPCSGAILVLLLALALDLRWAGIAAVFAMSLGTAATTAALAALAVYARNAALRLAARPERDGRRLAAAINAVGLAGGVVLAMLGGLLMQGALTAAPHPLF